MKAFLPLLLLALDGTAGARTDERPFPSMGAEWFARVVDPATRIKALWEIRLRERSKKEKQETFAEFSAGITYSAVFPCPQPGLPDAYAVVTGRNYPRTRLLLQGPGTDHYEPLPLESERWKQWQALDTRGTPDFRPWRIGQPLLESISVTPFDPKGTKLGESMFCGLGAIADFNGDGMLDLLEIERISGSAVKAGTHGLAVDCVSIGPLISGQNRFAMLYCNAPSWLFTIREQRDLPALVLVPADPAAGRELAFRIQEGKLAAQDVNLPEGIWIDPKPAGETWNAASAFLKERGYRGLGFGTEKACTLEAGRPKRDQSPAWKEPELEVPDPDDRPPREAATAIAAHLYDRYYDPFYEWQHNGPPVPPATQAWLEMEIDHGWSPDETHVWWLADGVAERWVASNLRSVGPKQRAAVEFTVTRLPAERLARDISVIQEFDRLRRVPGSPLAPEEENSSGSGADITTCQVRARTILPAPVTSNFEPSIPALWENTGSPYDRKVSSLLATIITQKLPEGEATQTRKIRELAPQWLVPERISKVPPALARIAIQAIGENDWAELKPLLEKLKESFGPPSPEEQRLADIDDEVRLNAKDKTKDYDEQYATTYRLAYERKQLLETLTGEPRHELRAAVEKALKGKAPAPGQ